MTQLPQFVNQILIDANAINVTSGQSGAAVRTLSWSSGIKRNKLQWGSACLTDTAHRRHCQCRVICGLISQTYLRFFVLCGKGISQEPQPIVIRTTWYDRKRDKSQRRENNPSVCLCLYMCPHMFMLAGVRRRFDIGISRFSTFQLVRPPAARRHQQVWKSVSFFQEVRIQASTKDDIMALQGWRATIQVSRCRLEKRTCLVRRRAMVYACKSANVSARVLGAILAIGTSTQ